MSDVCLTREELEEFISDPYRFVWAYDRCEDAGERWGDHGFTLYDYGNECFLIAYPSGKGSDYIFMTSRERFSQGYDDDSSYDNGGTTRQILIENLRDYIEWEISRAEPPGLYSDPISQDEINQALNEFLFGGVC